MTYPEYRSFDLRCQAVYAAAVNPKREQIVEAARLVLIREGSAGFSMRKVAHHAGMSLGHLQYYFPSRAELLDALLSADIEEYRRAFEEMRRKGHRGRHHLNRFLLQALGLAGRPDEIAVFRALFSFNEPELLESFERYYRSLYELLEQGLAQLASGSPGSPSIRRGAALLFPYLEGYETTGQYLTLGPKETAELLTDIVWGVLTAPEG